VRIKILDVEYALTGYEDEEYLRQVSEMVDRRMRLALAAERDATPLKTAILAALNLADELVRTRKQLEQYQSEAADFSREISTRSIRLARRCAKAQSG
jgi:cell division protein ZapA